jgi:hypothetical protein
MAAIVAFLIIHVALALIVPKTIGAMITGGPPVAPHNNEVPPETISRASARQRSLP